MKIKTHFISSLLSLAFAVCAILVVCCLQTTAQNSAESEKDKFLPPSEEQFETVDAVAAPWRSSGCYVRNYIYEVPNCHQVNGTDWDNADTLSLYNEDGSLWYQFSLTPEKADYFVKNTKKEFLPLTILPSTILPPRTVIIRLVGESPHWYKVEINEQTQATKYVLKNDSKWSKTEWIRWLHESKKIKVERKTEVRDKPDGEIIGGTSDIEIQRIEVLKAEGDWAYGIIIANAEGKPSKGWVRWRKGRDFLVGFILNDWTIPKLKTVADNK